MTIKIISRYHPARYCYCSRFIVFIRPYLNCDTFARGFKPGIPQEICWDSKCLISSCTRFVSSKFCEIKIKIEAAFRISLHPLARDIFQMIKISIYVLSMCYKFFENSRLSYKKWIYLKLLKKGSLNLMNYVFGLIVFYVFFRASHFQHFSELWKRGYKTHWVV